LRSVVPPPEIRTAIGMGDLRFESVTCFNALHH